MPETAGQTDAPLASTPEPKQGIADRLFRSNLRMASVARVILYAVLAATFLLGLGRVVRYLRTAGLNPIVPVRLFWMEACSVLAVLSAALVMSRFERRAPGVYGLPLRSAFRKLFWQGVLTGLAEVTVLVGLIAAFGGYSFGSVAVHGFALVRWLAFWAVLFVLVGLLEEFLFRGYAQYTLGAGIGFWPAALILSVAFGGLHLGNAGEGWVGALNVVVVGLFFCLTLRRTGNLWFAVGMHASFDFGETFLYSVPNSGFVAEGHLSNAALHGPAWLTGGTVGPEGSVFSFLTLGILFYVIHRVYPAKAGAAGHT